VTFIKIRSHRRKFSNSDSVEPKRYYKNFLHALLDSLMTSYPTLFEKKKNKLERELQVLYSDPELFGM
jgi:hypothetical protein